MLETEPDLRDHLLQVRILEGHLARVGSLSWTWNMLSSGSRDASIVNHDGIVLLLLLQSSVQKTKGTNAIIYAVRSFRHVSSKLKAHTGEVCGLKWSCGGDLLASGGNDNLVHVWESSKMGSSKYLHRFTDHRAAVRALAWCPFQPKTLASGGGTADQCVKIWNAQTGKCTNSINTSAQARRSRTQPLGITW